MTPTDGGINRATGTGGGAGAAAEMLRSRGMRELGPEEMRRFRLVERIFLEVTAERGYREIRTPTLEPLHLFTAAGTLSPQLLERVYSFLDWDGWSGERVVLRPDGTVPAARWLLEQEALLSADDLGDGVRLSYVEPVYRFVPGDGNREQWQAGVELFGLGAPEGEGELLGLAVVLLRALGLAPRMELAHAGIMRSAFRAAGLDPAQQLAAYDRVLDGDGGVTEELAAAYPAATTALRLLLDITGEGPGYLANLRAALLPVLPESEPAIEELAVAAGVFDRAGVPLPRAPGDRAKPGVLHRRHLPRARRRGRVPRRRPLRRPHRGARRADHPRLRLRRRPAAPRRSRPRSRLPGRRRNAAMSAGGSGEIRVALPRGDLRGELAERLQAAGFRVPGYGEGSRSYRFDVEGRPRVRVRVFSEADIPIQVALGHYDLGITGRAHIDELLVRYPHDSVIPLRALDIGESRLVLAGAAGATLDGLADEGILRVATEFPNLAARFLARARVPDHRLVEVWANAEAWPPEDADAAVVTSERARAEGLVELATLHPRQRVASRQPGGAHAPRPDGGAGPAARAPRRRGSRGRPRGSAPAGTPARAAASSRGGRRARDAADRSPGRARAAPHGGRARGRRDRLRGLR